MLVVLTSYMRVKYSESIFIFSRVINKSNRDSEIRNIDGYLLTKYRAPQRHKFNVTSGDMLIFHHIQKTGK